jgi:hypothetical protein
MKSSGLRGLRVLIRPRSWRSGSATASRPAPPTNSTGVSAARAAVSKWGCSPPCEMAIGGCKFRISTAHGRPPRNAPARNTCGTPMACACRPKRLVACSRRSISVSSTVRDPPRNISRIHADTSSLPTRPRPVYEIRAAPSRPRATTCFTLLSVIRRPPGNAVSRWSVLAQTTCGVTNVIARVTVRAFNYQSAPGRKLSEKPGIPRGARRRAGSRAAARSGQTWT